MELRRISVDLLIVDPDVQREWSEEPSRWKRMAATWDDHAVGVLDAVCLNGQHEGLYGVFIGRHRLLAAKAAGIKELRVDVHPPMSVADKYAMKLMKDRDRRNVRLIEHFLDAVEAGETAALEIVRTCRKAGFEVGKLSKGLPYTRIEAVHTLGSIHAQGHLDAVLALDTTWLDEPGTNTGSWLGGLNAAVRSGWPNRLTPAGYERLRRVVPVTLMKQAKGEAAYGGGNLLRNPVAIIISEKLRKAAGVR